jgi:hypothetical protein
VGAIADSLGINTHTDTCKKTRFWLIGYAYKHCLERSILPVLILELEHLPVGFLAEFIYLKRAGCYAGNKL